MSDKREREETAMALFAEAVYALVRLGWTGHDLAKLLADALFEARRDNG